MNICRCCKKSIKALPVFELRNMPKSAQDFIDFGDEKALKEDVGDDIVLYQCEACGLVQIFQPPVSYYKDVIRATSVSKEMRSYRYNQYSDFINKYDLKGKKILELGCGSGEYMDIMRLVDDISVYGLENRLSSVVAAKKKGHLVQQGYIDIEDYSLDDGPFHAFYIMNFLEHMPEPDVYLKGILKNLTDDAVGLVEVPNFDMMLKEKVFSEFISDHLMYFTKDTFVNMLEVNGFEVISCEPIWYDYIISAVVRKKKKTDFSIFDSQLLKIKKEVNLFIDLNMENGEIAVWGAGHQALANLSLLGISNRIKCVIDSADFKQNKLTPATHLPIVAPEILENSNIRTVIIMAGSYSDEIARSLKYKNHIKTAILRGDGLEVIL